MESSPPDGFVILPLWQTRPAALHALLRTAYADGGGSVPDFDDWWWPLVEDREFDPALLIVAAHPTGQPAGLIQCWTSAFVKDLVVAPDARNRGLGSWLLQHAFAIFAARGASHVDLKVQAGNSGARRFYARHGMVEVH